MHLLWEHVYIALGSEQVNAHLGTLLTGWDLLVRLLAL